MIFLELVGNVRLEFIREVGVISIDLGVIVVLFLVVGEVVCEVVFVGLGRVWKILFCRIR